MDMNFFLMFYKYIEDIQLTTEVLEKLITLVDEMRETPPLLSTFKRLRQQILCKKDLLFEIYEKSEREGFQRVRKVGG